jgi:D-sedoheptulose 7-phosphate isomerase
MQPKDKNEFGDKETCHLIDLFIFTRNNKNTMASIQQNIKDRIAASIEVKQALLGNEQLLTAIEQVVNVMIETFKNDGKVLFCGNGGSAADAQHIAAELSGRFYKDRPPLYAEALHVNGSYITAVANDYSYDAIYSRAVKAQGRSGDVLIAISTSGNSGNIVAAVEEGKKQGMVVVGMTGENGGKMKDMCDHLLNVPSSDTPRIQEAHILVGHILCEFIENALY